MFGWAINLCQQTQHNIIQSIFPSSPLNYTALYQLNYIKKYQRIMLYRVNNHTIVHILIKQAINVLDNHKIVRLCIKKKNPQKIFAFSAQTYKLSNHGGTMWIRAALLLVCDIHQYKANMLNTETFWTQVSLQDLTAAFTLLR